jgi:WhiB family redox-sensing transcriptional regulator
VKDMSWLDSAACRGVNPEVFFPIKTGNGARREAAEAILICRECPVILQCRLYARTAARGFGVWGGHLRSSRKAS